jgi:methylated-DNA-protein-cysteine methyltransferase-like protein
MHWIYLSLVNKRQMPKKRMSSTALPVASVTGKRSTSFFEDVYSIVRQIPKGRVTSYGAIAAALGTRLSARMVGWALNNAHIIAPPIPAHRVVNRAGLLTGKMHFSHPERMQELLEAEGIKVNGDQVEQFEKLFWNPEKELGLD